MTRRPWCSPAGRELGYGAEAMAAALATVGKLPRAGIDETDALGDKDSARGRSMKRSATSSV
jgi:hypothetical protein